MGKNIFEGWARRYWEWGFDPIPLYGKRAIVDRWQRWSVERMPEEELERMIAQFPMANIGIVLGRSCSVIDIDTDNPDVLRVKPYSPYRRFGSKGIVLFCAPSTEPSRSSTQVGYPVEFLNVGKYVVVPPSIHPDTGEVFKSVGEQGLDSFSLEDAPKYSSAMIDNLAAACKKAGVALKQRAVGDSGDITDVGRNNKLTLMAYAKACDSVPIQKGVEELLAFDKKEHSPAWFEDTKEPHKGKNPHKEATAMYKRAIDKATKLGHVRPVVELKINLASLTAPATNDPWIPYPKARGVMGAFVDYCQLTATGAQDALGLGGALAFMSTLLSNRYYTEAHPYSVYPNNFIINLAHSGFGKETPQRVIHELLADTGLIGSSNYKSGTSIVMHLPAQQERIDLLDECSAFLKSMTSKEDYKSEIVEVLSGLYTKSDSRFIGIASRADGMQFGACWNPCVNILGSTTPNGFRGSVNRDMAAKGLMPRFLIFYQKHVGTYFVNDDLAKVKILKEHIKAFIKYTLSKEKRIHPEYKEDLASADKSRRYAPELVPMTEGALREWQLISRHYFEEGSKNPEGFESAFKNRFAQHVVKLALLDTLSMGGCEITTESVEWARAVVETQWANVQELYKLATAESSAERDLLRCREVVDNAGQMSKSQFTQKTRWLYNTKQRDDILKTLMEMEAVRIVRPVDSHGLGRPADLIVSVKTGSKELLQK